MSPLQFKELHDRERIFYESEAKFVESSGVHFRALATISATELGFLLTVLTLAGTNPLAKQVVTDYIAFIAPVGVLLIVSLIFSSIVGRLISLSLLHGNRASFLADAGRIEISEMPVNARQAMELAGIVNKGSKKDNRKFKVYSYAHYVCRLLATVSFFGANGLFLSLVVLRAVG